MEFFLNDEVWNRLQQQIAAKQDRPENEGSAGQVLALALVNDELVPVWITPAGGGGDITDVQVNGTSVVSHGVANVPIASTSNLGVVYDGGSYGYYGITINNDGIVKTTRAEDGNVKTGTHAYRPIVPYIQHLATFYGLAKAAGSDEKNSSLAVGQYTDAAKQAILSMLGIRFQRKAVNVAEVSIAAGGQQLISLPSVTGYVPVFTRFAFGTGASGNTHMLCFSGIVFQGAENRVRVFNMSNAAVTLQGSLQVYYMETNAFTEVQ